MGTIFESIRVGYGFLIDLETIRGSVIGNKRGWGRVDLQKESRLLPRPIWSHITDLGPNCHNVQKATFVQIASLVETADNVDMTIFLQTGLYITSIKPDIRVSYDKNLQNWQQRLQHFQSDSKVDCWIKSDDSVRASKFLISSENEPQQTS